MVKISYSPIKELVVHEAVKVDFDDLMRGRITPAGNMPLYWCDGVVFSFNSMPMSRDIIRDYLQGTIHWMEVHYSDMKKYEPVLELNDEQYKATIHVRVIDTSRSSLHNEMIKWLKSRK
ncbi:MAG: hypothetical protein ACREBH_03805 [Candidatus Micrarchaeaceae archaeon]